MTGASSTPSDGEDTVVIDGTMAEPTAEPTAGATLGRYVVIDELGRGAMGVVLRAYDPRLQREIALKRLHPRAITAADRQRVVREARALAKIAHPNVVGVFDVEDQDGAVTLVMEHVRGAPLSVWLQRPRGLSEILAVLREVGSGLAAAHAEGVLHRDVKPANVIVGDDGRARILDFGLARPDVTGTRVTDSHSGPFASLSLGEDSDALTRAGTVMGTPAYMAPEQHRSAELTSAADQYALCVMAWEALCGKRPFAARDYDALARAKDQGPPAWPKDAARRVPTSIVDAVRRGLAADPDARWPTVGELVAVLSTEPTRRRRQAAWLGVTVVAAGGTFAAAREAPSADSRCTGAAAQLVDVWDDAQRERVHAAMVATGLPFADAAWDQARAHLDAYADGWASMHQATCEATAVRHEQSEHILDLRMACLSRARGGLAATGRVLAAADAEVVGRVGALVDGLVPLSRCEDVPALEAEVAPPPEHEAVAVAELRSDVAQARAQRLAGKYATARERMAAVRTQAQGLSYVPVLAEVSVELGQDVEAAGDWAESEVILRAALEVALRNGQHDEATTAATELVRILGDRLDRYPEAHAFASVARGLVGPEESNVRAAVALRDATARLLNSEGDFQRSEVLLRGGLALLRAEHAADSREVLLAREELAATLRLQRRFDEARTEGEAVLAIRTAALGPDHPDVAEILAAIGKTNQGAKRGHEALPLFQRALAIRTRTLGPDHPTTADSHQQLGIVYTELGDLEGAERELQSALATMTQAVGPRHARVAGINLSLASVYSATSRRAEARECIARAAAIFDETMGADHLVTGIPKHMLAQLLFADGEFQEAERYEREAIAIMGAHRHPVVPDLQASLGEMLFDRGKFAAAASVAELAYQARRESTPQQWRWSAFLLARSLWEVGDERARALQLARACEAAGAAGDGPPDPELTAWLAAHAL